MLHIYNAHKCAAVRRCAQAVCVCVCVCIIETLPFHKGKSESRGTRPATCHMQYATYSPGQSACVFSLSALIHTRHTQPAELWKLGYICWKRGNNWAEDWRSQTNGVRKKSDSSCQEEMEMINLTGTFHPKKSASHATRLNAGTVMLHVSMLTYQVAGIKCYIL